MTGATVGEFYHLKWSEDRLWLFERRGPASLAKVLSLSGDGLFVEMPGGRKRKVSWEMWRKMLGGDDAND